MMPEQAPRLAVLTSQLAEILMAAAICAQEIRAMGRDENDDDFSSDSARPEFRLSPSLPCHKQRPLLDESTLCVIWNGKSLHLGYTRSFRLLGRLARRPNQYVTHLDLLQDVWDGKDLRTATIRSVVRHLRRSLCKGGMEELASAIRGHNERYILDL